MADATKAQLNAAIHRIIAEHDPNMKYRIEGVPYDLGDEEEWIMGRNLSVYSIAARSDVHFDRLFIEVLCYSFEGQRRRDKNWNRVWEIADTYATLLSGKRFVVESSCMQVKEARCMFLDLRSLGHGAENINQQSPLLHVQCVAVGCEVVILQPKG